MLARLGPAKCMLIALTPKWMKKVIETDQKNKRNKILKKIEEEKLKGSTKNLEFLTNILKKNENRNFNADVIITESSNKFKFEKYMFEVAVKEHTKSSGAFTNKEFIGAAYYHFYSRGLQKEFEERMQKYANQ